MKAVVGTQVALDKMRGQVEVCIPVEVVMEAVVGTQVMLDKMRCQAAEVCIPVVGTQVVMVVLKAAAVVGTCL